MIRTASHAGDSGHGPLEPTFDPGSFRDRFSRVFIHQSRVYRACSEQALMDWRRVSRQPFFEELASQKKIVETRELTADEAAQLPMSTGVVGVLHHERIPFISYPYEWPFSMLRAAAALHLEILSAAILAGTILKDASPYNVQFRGSHPVFIDIGSFIVHADNEPWTGYRQFCEMMLFPLLLQAYRGIDLQPILRANLEGISAREFLRSLSWRDRFRPGVFTHGCLQSWLEQQTGSSETDTVGALQSSGFDRSLIEQNLRKLTRLIGRLNWQPARTHWARYRHALPHVVQDTQRKAEFVREVCQVRRRQLVWDLGCNDGHFSRIAAEHAATVVAMDHDHGCVERLYLDLVAERCENILPLRMDLLNQSPAQGWRGRERLRLEDRGQPELVLCLGLIHHLVIAGNIPLPEVVGWLASLRAEVVIEFPSKLDPMVRGLLRNKADQYDDYSLAALEASLHSHGFDIRNRTELPSGERTLLHVTPAATE